MDTHGGLIAVLSKMSLTVAGGDCAAGWIDSLVLRFAALGGAIFEVGSAGAIVAGWDRVVLGYEVYGSSDPGQSCQEVGW